MRYIISYLFILHIYRTDSKKFLARKMLTFFIFLFFKVTSIAKVNSGRSIPKAEVTSANSQTEVTLANFYISGLFHATTGI